MKPVLKLNQFIAQYFKELAEELTVACIQNLPPYQGHTLQKTDEKLLISLE